MVILISSLTRSSNIFIPLLRKPDGVHMHAHTLHITHVQSLLILPPGFTIYRDGMWLEIEVTYLMAPESPLTLLRLASVYDYLIHLHILWETEYQCLGARLCYHATTSQHVVLHVNCLLIYDPTYYTCSSINSTKVAGVRLKFNIIHMLEWPPGLCLNNPEPYYPSTLPDTLVTVVVSVSCIEMIDVYLF